MQQQEIYDFLIRYFKTNNCEITSSGPGYFTVQLTVDMDKELMNRPFYWHYLEKIGGVPNPMSLTLITDQSNVPENVKGEFIHFGSPRLHQIFTSSQKLGRHIRLFEDIQVHSGQIALFPWLCMNLNISYQCDRKKDILCSIGLNLINGMVVEDFMSILNQYSLSPKISDYTFTLSPIIRHTSGFNRIKQYIQTKIIQDDHTWAEEARLRWKKDLDLLTHFYTDKSEEEEDYSFETEKEALRQQYEPSIQVKTVNGGLFYLTKHAL